MPPTAFEIPVPDWQTFAQLVAEHGDGSWIFRGVTREEHQLVPAIGRLRKDGLGDTGRHYTPDAEIKCLAMFKRAARPFLPFVPDTELEWLTIAQHYGLRTRLLDWTESPLVAAFFATEAPDRNGAPAIYCSKAPPDATPAEQADPLHAMRDVKTFRAPHLNTRIQVQRSIVTVHPRPWEAYAPEGLKKWVFAPRQASLTIKQVLDTCGVNWASVFPGLEGLSQYINWRYEHGRLA